MFNGSLSWWRDECRSGSGPGSPLVVEYAPQLELLAKARLTITHAGLNTVLDSLSSRGTSGCHPNHI